MSDCLFCKIEKGDIPSEKVYEDERLFVIKDINPQAPTHLLVIPRKHHSTILELQEDDFEMIGSIYGVAGKLARQLGMADDGFRVVVNCGRHGGQSVYHIHFHILGGRPMAWPPG
ncbi:MAG: histidine triad nucleotide-binding protein [Candidatus Nitrohelix vancouverensis]|uniref:Histidine triad nucleotide-binding protein n=1 Tax=Candidatus Nitrohelix vancouverensis TaxID=2705534 RepID=A0A7T0G2K1_9BACT|nr:MAG: histidine triad nucleotide-binding protein [Candidatus Nitrohelix vancouverensis]